MTMSDHTCDLLVIGAGPAGLYAAYYAGFRGWSTVVMDNLPEAGGQITAMYPEKDIFDVAGFPAVRGRELVDALVKQAEPFSPTYLLGHQAVELSAPADGPVRVTSATGLQVEAKACVITGGIGAFSPRPMPAGTGWEGKGLVYFVPRMEEFRDQDVVIVGGGDSAFDWASMLHPVARSIRIVHRREQFRAHGSMVEKVRELGVALHTPCEVTGVEGGDRIASVDITSKTTGLTETVPADTVIAAQDHTRAWIAFLIAKAQLMARLAGTVNARQEKALLRILREGPRGFEGGLSAGNYIRITGATPATARRDLADLVRRGVLARTGEKKTTRYWLVLDGDDRRG